MSHIHKNIKDFLNKSKLNESNGGKITLYKYFGSGYYDGSCYPPYDKTNTEWTPDKQSVIDAYNNVSIKNFNSVELSDVDFIWCIVQSVEVPLDIWNNKNIEDVSGYIDDVYTNDIVDIAEKGIDYGGFIMDKDEFESIIYEKNVKPEGIVYGNL